MPAAAVVAIAAVVAVVAVVPPGRCVPGGGKSGYRDE
jgi:hypothetical protein